MSDSCDQVILITGASSGIGHTCAQYLAQRGYQVFGTSRRAPFPPKALVPGAVTMLQMDVNQDASVQRGVDFILQEKGQLDVVMNNAGFGIAGAVEDTTVEEAQALFETNFFGVLRVCKAVLPAMRAQESGLIVNVSSIGGLIALPFQAFYSATKFAVEGMTEALRLEVRPFGIDVVLLEPGDISTPFVDNRRRVAGCREGSIYTGTCERMMSIIEKDERNGIPPKRVARLLERIIEHPSPKLRYRVGSFDQKLAAALKGLVPDRLFEQILMRNYDLL